MSNLIGINSPVRLLREQWGSPKELAEELYAMFTAKGPAEMRDTLTIRVPEGRPALEIERQQDGDTFVTRDPPRVGRASRASRPPRACRAGGPPRGARTTPGGPPAGYEPGPPGARRTPGGPPARRGGGPCRVPARRDRRPGEVLGVRPPSSSASRPCSSTSRGSPATSCPRWPAGPGCRRTSRAAAGDRQPRWASSRTAGGILMKSPLSERARLPARRHRDGEDPADRPRRGDRARHLALGDRQVQRRVLVPAARVVDLAMTPRLLSRRSIFARQVPRLLRAGPEPRLPGCRDGIAPPQDWTPAGRLAQAAPGRLPVGQPADVAVRRHARLPRHVAASYVQADPVLIVPGFDTVLSFIPVPPPRGDLLVLLQRPGAATRKVYDVRFGRIVYYEDSVTDTPGRPLGSYDPAPGRTRSARSTGGSEPRSRRPRRSSRGPPRPNFRRGPAARPNIQGPAGGLLLPPPGPRPGRRVLRYGLPPHPRRDAVDPADRRHRRLRPIRYVLGGHGGRGLVRLPSRCRRSRRRSSGSGRRRPELPQATGCTSTASTTRRAWACPTTCPPPVADSRRPPT